jgi:hypothetical protein
MSAWLVTSELHGKEGIGRLYNNGSAGNVAFNSLTFTSGITDGINFDLVCHPRAANGGLGFIDDTVVLTLTGVSITESEIGSVSLADGPDATVPETQLIRRWSRTNHVGSLGHGSVGQVLRRRRSN